MAIVIPDGKHPDDIFVIQNENYLMNNIEARHYTSYLFVNNVFSEDEMDSVDDTVEFQERNRLMLKILTEKGRDGFRVFKKALHRRGYLNMDLIEHKMKVRKESTMGPKHIIIDRAWREFIDPKDETKIIQNRAILIRKMDASRLTSYLATKQVIDGYDMTTIDTLPKTLANKELLRIVCGRGSTAFMWFVEALRVNGFGRLSTLLFGRPITSSTIQADSGDSDDSSSGSSSSSFSSDDDKDKVKDDEAQPKKTHDSQSQAVGDSQSNKSNGDVQLHTITQDTEHSDNRETQSDKDKDTQSQMKDDGAQAQKTHDGQSQDTEQSDNRQIQSDKDQDTQSNRSNIDSQTNPSDGEHVQKDQNNYQSENSNTDTTEGNSETQMKHEDSTDEGTSPDEDTRDATHQYDPDKERMSDIQEEDSVQGRDDDGTNDVTEPSNQSKSNDNVKPQSRNSQRSGKSRREKRPRTPRSPFKKIIFRNVIREPIDYVQAEKLKCHLRELERSLDAEPVASELVESGIIDRLDVETISALREPHQKVRELIGLILWSGSDGFKLFLDALLETNQTLLHRVLTNQKKNSIRVNKSAIPSIIIDEVGQSRDEEDDDNQPLPTTTSPARSKQIKFRWAPS